MQADTKRMESIAVDAEICAKHEIVNSRHSVVSTSNSSTPSQSSAAQKETEFSVVWQHLSYKVDSRHWHTKLRERLFGASVGNQQASLALDDVGDNNIEPLPRRRERTILNGICGDVKSGQLTGILGPSGAGKSSLLYCLFQNRTLGTTGRILVDAKSKRKKLKVCFIPQKDYLNEWLTVREDLIFVSKLRSARFNILRDNSDSNLASSSSNQNIKPTSTFVKQCSQGYSTRLIDHDENALRVAELLGITNCLDVPIRKISGGQKKRLSVARELMSTPDVLILDEPTTGLDSLTCYKTVSVLRDLARFSPHPMAVIVTIHQPQRSVFNLFDKTYFISNKGRVVYDDSPQNVVATLARVADFNPPSAKYNPAATLIEICSDPAQQASYVELLSADQQTKFNERYDAQHIRRLMKSKREDKNRKSESQCLQISEPDASPNSANNRQNRHLVLDSLNVGVTSAPVSPKALTPVVDRVSTSSNTFPSSTTEEYFISRQLRDCRSGHADKSLIRSIRHIFILTHRSWLSIIRNPSMTRSRFMFHASLPLIMLLIFGTKSGSPNNCPALNADLDMSNMRASMSGNIIEKNVEETRLAMENISLYFLLMYGFGINIISTTASHYPMTIHMYKKETINGLYSSAPYFIGQTLADLPLEVLFPSISVILAYSLSGQISSYLEWRMFAVTLLTFLLCYTVHSLGLLYGSIFINNINVAVLVGQITLFPAIILSGFLIKNQRMPPWMFYLSRVSFFQYALKGVVAARYGFNVCECDEDTIPDDGQGFKFKGIPENVKHVLDYMFPKNDTDGIVMGDIFDKMSERFIKAQTFALNITSCDDVKPYVMTTFEVQDSHIWTSIMALCIMIAVLKFATFSIVRLSPYRID